MIQLYVIHNAPVSNFAMPHVQITSLFSFKYTGFNIYNISVLSTINIPSTILNIMCHAADMKRKTR